MNRSALTIVAAFLLVSPTVATSREGSSVEPVRFQATNRHVDLAKTGSANWGGVSVSAKTVVWFATSDRSMRLIVYFIPTGSPDPGPQYNPVGKTGALFFPESEFPKWADLVYSGRTVYVKLETTGAHGHSVSTYPW